MSEEERMRLILSCDDGLARAAYADIGEALDLVASHPSDSSTSAWIDLADRAMNRLASALGLPSRALPVEPALRSNIDETDVVPVEISPCIAEAAIASPALRQFAASPSGRCANCEHYPKSHYMGRRYPTSGVLYCDDLPSPLTSLPMVEADASAVEPSLVDLRASVVMLESRVVDLERLLDDVKNECHNRNSTSREFFDNFENLVNRVVDLESHRREHHDRIVDCERRPSPPRDAADYETCETSMDVVVSVADRETGQRLVDSIPGAEWIPAGTTDPRKGGARAPMDARLVRDLISVAESVPRLRELATRLIAPGPKAERVSASECYEIADGLCSALDVIVSMRGEVAP